MEQAKDISVVIPTHNEAGNIGRLLKSVSENLLALNLRYELIVVDGGSTDGTAAEASAAGARVIVQRRFGYGGALREGLAAAAGDYILTLDADNSHPASLIAKLWEARERADVIIASRLIPGGSSQASAFRQTLTRVLNLVYSKVLNIPHKDLSSGYRLYRHSVVTPNRYTSENFNIVPEILVRAYADGYSAYEVPLEYLERGEGTSHVSLWRFAKSYLVTLYQLWKLRNSVESADYDHRAFHSKIPLQLYWQRKRHSHVNGFLRSGKRILDVGCGSSKIIQMLPDAVAMDFAQRKLRYLSKTNPHRVRASTFQLPFRDQSFDQAIHSQVIEHIPLDRSIYTELNRVLTPGGTLVIGTPDYGRIWWPIIEYFYGLILPNAYADEHITHYTRHSLFEILAENGFRVLAYRYICGGELIVQAEKVAAV